VEEEEEEEGRKRKEGIKGNETFKGLYCRIERPLTGKEGKKGRYAAVKTLNGLVKKQEGMRQ